MTLWTVDVPAGAHAAIDGRARLLWVESVPCERSELRGKRHRSIRQIPISHTWRIVQTIAAGDSRKTRKRTAAGIESAPAHDARELIAGVVHAVAAAQHGAASQGG